LSGEGNDAGSGPKSDFALLINSSSGPSAKRTAVLMTTARNVAIVQMVFLPKRNVLFLVSFIAGLLNAAAHFPNGQIGY
jgi:hypothetical protein